LRLELPELSAAVSAHPFWSTLERGDVVQGRMTLKHAHERSIAGDEALLHRGACTLYKNDFGYISREGALIALAETDIEACQICNPQNGLG
jgi:hypothetical protein